jgi:hypothetical protein
MKSEVGNEPGFVLEAVSLQEGFAKADSVQIAPDPRKATGATTEGIRPLNL